MPGIGFHYCNDCINKYNFREYYYGSRYTGAYADDTTLSGGLGADPSLVNFDSFLNARPNLFNKLSGRTNPDGKYSGILDLQKSHGCISYAPTHYMGDNIYCYGGGRGG